MSSVLKSSSLELKDRKVSDPKVMLKPEFAKKKSLRLNFVKVGIGHHPAQTPMSAPIYLKSESEDRIRGTNQKQSFPSCLIHSLIQFSSWKKSNKNIVVWI